MREGVEREEEEEDSVERGEGGGRLGVGQRRHRDDGRCSLMVEVSRRGVVGGGLRCDSAGGLHRVTKLASCLVLQ